MDAEERVNLFRDMVACCHNLYFWTYDSGFYLIASNCPEQAMVADLFAASHRREDFDRELTAQSAPVIFTNEIGLMWVMAPLLEQETLVRLYVLGPFLIDDLSTQSLEDQLQKHHLSYPLRQSFRDFLGGLPVISLNRIFEYAIMLCFCVTGEKTTVSDLRYHNNRRPAGEKSAQREFTDYHGTYQGEQEMLRMVREGDLNYRVYKDKLSMTGNMGKMSNGSPLRQAKNAVLAGITLYARAAMEGGLAPEVAYTLSDYYFQSVEACSSVADLVDLAHTIEEDYVQRVHRCRTSNLSKPIQASCEYISLHLEDKITLAQLAQQAGYSEFYFGKKFKNEVHMTPNEYIRQQRLERAALLLRTTLDDVQDISARLQFCSQSYFADHFRKRFGVTPTEYRLQKKE